MNDAYRLCPDADYLYACDERWWRHYIENVRAKFKGELWTQYHNEATKKFADDFGINCMEGRGNNGLGRKAIHHGGNSGYQAINFCWLISGGKVGRIFLLGYDMGRTGGKSHFFGEHPKGMHNGNYQNFVHQFTQLAADLASEGVEVVNMSRATNLTQFKRATIDDYTDFHSLK